METTSPKKKKIFIIIIIFCVLATGGVLYYGTQPASTPSDIVVTGSGDTQAAAESAPTSIGAVGSQYRTPKVFPEDTTFEKTLLDSESFKALRPYTPLTVTKEELGRPDPFSKP